MTKTAEARAIITASYILYLIDGLLDKSEHNLLTTIRLKQLLRSKTSRAQNKYYIELSNIAWQRVVDTFKDKKYSIAIFDAVESLAFNEEENMTAMFGTNFIPTACSFALKQTRDGVPKEVLLQSREVTDALKVSVGKVVFDNKEKL